MGPILTGLILLAGVAGFWLAKYYYFDEERLHWGAALAIAIGALLAIVGTVLYYFAGALPF